MEYKSFLNKKWAEAPTLDKSEELFDLLLQGRGLNNPEKVQDFISPTLEDLHDPMEMDGMEAAMKRIEKAIKNKERIIIFGDFDVDGITSTVILVQGLQDLGANVSYRIPDRGRDSHGLKDYLIDEIATKNVSLIITCDCGVNDAKEVTHAKNLGIDVIITDHHDSDSARFPHDAVAVLNPSLMHCPYPEENLSGSGIAFKLISALFERRGFGTSPTEISKFLEIAALGLIADCVPLTGENRILAKFGLEKMKETKWSGLKQLLEQTNTEPENLDEETIGFTIAPRLNAASRIGNVMTACQLFLGHEGQHTQRISELEELNEMRRDLTEKAFQEAAEQVVKGAPFQFFIHEEWIPGILGLIAGRYVEQLNVPVIAARIYEGGIVKASCRAPEGYSIITALRTCGNLFSQFGGHDGAAGFSLEQGELEDLKTRLNKYLDQLEPLDAATKVTAFLSEKLLNLDVLDFLRSLAPFGVGNEMPIFGLKNVKVFELSQMGKNKNHLRMQAQTESGKKLDFVGFFLGDLFETLHGGQKVEVIFTMSENWWNDERRLQLRLVDVKKI